ncbi:hypothetical protein O3W44_22495 [Pantoea sp. LMR881]|uniref:hypothetical protein n=1 Tax=Pantoea sp. LMR881 TaxID=3014336 RepID=UPI0022AFCD44|nr:hypothetical protein [Pantoea sp. LMR881]MCZ4061193.1 hypothetical protein [Pantoea sp. LMR881]MCZ4061304.1 hypothetical protein [Pantoea sp. LMR881]
MEKMTENGNAAKYKGQNSYVLPIKTFEPAPLTLCIGNCKIREVNGRLEFEGDIDDKAKDAFNYFFANYMHKGEVYHLRRKVERLELKKHKLSSTTSAASPTVVKRFFDSFKLRLQSFAKPQYVKANSVTVTGKLATTARIVPTARYNYLVCHPQQDKLFLPGSVLRNF